MNNVSILLYLLTYRSLIVGEHVITAKYEGGCKVGKYTAELCPDWLGDSIKIDDPFSYDLDDREWIVWTFKPMRDNMTDKVLLTYSKTVSIMGNNTQNYATYNTHGLEIKNVNNDAIGIYEAHLYSGKGPRCNYVNISIAELPQLKTNELGISCRKVGKITDVTCGEVTSLGDATLNLRQGTKYVVSVNHYDGAIHAELPNNLEDGDVTCGLDFTRDAGRCVPGAERSKWMASSKSCEKPQPPAKPNSAKTIKSLLEMCVCGPAVAIFLLCGLKL